MTQITIESRIRKVCAKDHSRYAINGVEYRPIDDESCYLSATDGRVLAVVKAEHVDPGPVEIIPADVIPNKLSGGRLIRTADNGNPARWEDPASRKYGEAIDATFPPCFDVLPAINGSTKAISFNAELLANLAQAIGRGADGEPRAVVTLFIGKPGKPIAVKGAGDAIGVIMPCATPDNVADEYEAARAAYGDAVNAKDPK